MKTDNFVIRVVIMGFSQLSIQGGWYKHSPKPKPWERYLMAT